MNRPLQKCFALLCHEAGLPPPGFEFRIEALKPRRWRYDIAWPDHYVLVEVEGGVWPSLQASGKKVRGRHVQPQGFLDDMEKYNAAQLVGYQVLRYTPTQILLMDTIREIHTLLERKKPCPTCRS